MSLIGGDASGGAGALASASPWGAAASAIGQGLATATSSETGDVSTGPITVGGLNFGGSRSSQWSTLAMVAVAIIGAAWIIKR